MTLIGEHHIPFVPGHKRVDPVLVKVYLDTPSDPAVKPTVKCDIVFYVDAFFSNDSNGTDTVYYNDGMVLGNKYTPEQAALILAAVENTIGLFANNIEGWLG